MQRVYYYYYYYYLLLLFSVIRSGIKETLRSFQAKYVAGLKIKTDKMRPSEVELQKIEFPLTPSDENVPVY